MFGFEVGDRNGGECVRSRIWLDACCVKMVIIHLNKRAQLDWGSAEVLVRNKGILSRHIGEDH
jgi:hypothetical protein